MSNLPVPHGDHGPPAQHGNEVEQRRTPPQGAYLLCIAGPKHGARLVAAPKGSVTVHADATPGDWEHSVARLSGLGDVLNRLRGPAHAQVEHRYDARPLWLAGVEEWVYVHEALAGAEPVALLATLADALAIERNDLAHQVLGANRSLELGVRAATWMRGAREPR